MSRAPLPVGANVAVYALFLIINIPLQLLCSGLFLSLSRIRDDAAVEQSRKLTLALSLNAVNTTMGSWIVGGSVMGLNLVIAIVLISFVRLYLTQRIALLAMTGTDLILGTLRIYDLIPFGTVLSSPERALGKSFSAAALGWRLMTIYISFIAASYAAGRFRMSEHALSMLNSELAVRVQDQVKALERASRLRRYLAPQLVEELLSAELEPAKTRDRRPITVMFADLQDFTGLVERLPPDALADTLNFFFDQVAKVAFKHGGTIDLKNQLGLRL